MEPLKELYNFRRAINILIFKCS